MLWIRTRFLLAVLFFTVFSSLIYELVWTRKLSQVFGTSAMAESTVLAVFMAGLALGSLFGGRLLDRARRPYRFLAFLELSIGGTCLLASLAFNLLHDSYNAIVDLTGGGTAFNVVLFLLAAVILIVPTFLIGAAFPVIVQLVHRERQQVGLSVGSCYMADTLGGSLGLLVAAFWLVPRIGFFRVSVLASLINLGLGLLILGAFRVAKREKANHLRQEPSGDRRPIPDRERLALVLFFFSGFAALTFEVIWIRHISLIYGGSLYSFAIVVVSFLLGLGVGSWLHNRVLARVAGKVPLFAAITLLIGLSGLLLTALLPSLEVLFLRIYTAVDGYTSFMLLWGLVCVGLLLIPTMLMGMTLPVLASVVAPGEHLGTEVGRLFAVNSFGALFGSFCAGFFIIPLLGIKQSAFVAGGIYALIALLFLLVFERSPGIRWRSSLAGLLLIGVTAIGYLLLWNPRHVYNGVFYQGTVYSDYLDAYLDNQQWVFETLRFLEQDPHGQVAVFGDPPDELYVTNNGKVEASSDPEGRAPQYLLADIPMFLHEDAADVLIIGLGGGWTVAEALKHDVSSVAVVEINQAMVDVNSGYLRPYNDEALFDPRTEVIVRDGRNYLSNTTRKYDAIMSEPPEIWVSGVSSLFTREFYVTVRRALNEGGLFSQWFPRYEMTEADYRIALNTLGEVFPYLYEFDMVTVTGLRPFQEYVVVGSAQPIDVEETLGLRRFNLGMSDSEHTAHLLSMLRRTESSFHRSHEQIMAMTADTTRVNVDDLPILEFRTLRNRFRKFKRE